MSKLASVRVAVQHRWTHWRTMTESVWYVLSKARKILRIPANKDIWVTWLSRQTQLQYCHRALGSCDNLLQEFAKSVQVECKRTNDYDHTKPRLHVLFKALRKPVYVKPISCKRIKAVSKPIWLNHIRRWFETGLKRFRRACKQLKRFKPLYKIQVLTLPSLLFSKRSPSPIASKPGSSHAGMSPTASKHER